MAPRVLSERRSPTQDRLEARVDRHALASQLDEVVRLPEFAIVPREETLQRLLGGLLAVKRRVAKQRRRCSEVDLGATQVVVGAHEPRARIRGANGIRWNR